MLNEKEELQNRLNARKKHLEAKLEEAKADTREGASERVEQLQNKLREFQEVAKINLDNLTESGAEKINEFLKEEAPLE